MPYAVMLYFDKTTEKNIKRVWKDLSLHNLVLDDSNEGFRPHITLAIYDELECKPCESELVRISAKTNFISFKFTHLGIFTNPEPVIFAAPMVTRELLDFHMNLHTSLVNEAKKPWVLYQPGKWIPHCTLALNFDLENITEIVRHCQTLNFPHEVRAEQVGVVEFQPVRDLFKYDFLN